jgi:hypothetical protein
MKTYEKISVSHLCHSASKSFNYNEAGRKKETRDMLLKSQDRLKCWKGKFISGNEGEYGRRSSKNLVLLPLIPTTLILIL